MDDEAASEEGSPLEEVVAGVVIALTFVVGFGLLALDYPWFWIAFPVGFAGLLPAAIGLVRLYESRDGRPDEPERDALEALRGRYVRGEIDEAEFERRLDLLLETESVSQARAHAARREAERDRESTGESPVVEREKR